jgi:hypothetical protein
MAHIDWSKLLLHVARGAVRLSDSTQPSDGALPYVLVMGAGIGMIDAAGETTWADMMQRAATVYVRVVDAQQQTTPPSPTVSASYPFYAYALATAPSRRSRRLGRAKAKVSRKRPHRRRKPTPVAY